MTNPVFTCGNGTTVRYHLTYPKTNAVGEPLMDNLLGARVYAERVGETGYKLVAETSFPDDVVEFALPRGEYAIRHTAVGHGIKGNGQENPLCILEGKPSKPVKVIVNDVPPSQPPIGSAIVPCPTGGHSCCPGTPPAGTCE